MLWSVEVLFCICACDSIWSNVDGDMLLKNCLQSLFCLLLVFYYCSRLCYFLYSPLLLVSLRVCACLFHCALHTVWTELRFTLVTTAVFTWEQNKTKKTYWLLKVSVNCVLMCVNSLLHLHLQATCDKLAWLLCHDSYPYTYTLILPVLLSIMNAWSTSPFRVEFIKEPLLEEFKNMPIGDTGKGI